MPYKIAGTRPKRVTVRVNEAENRTIYEKAEKMKLSASGYMRYAALSMQDEMIEKILRAVDNKQTILRVISGISSNLNQAMRQVHIFNKGKNEKDVEIAINSLIRLILEAKHEWLNMVKKVEPEHSKKPVQKTQQKEVKQCQQ